jgi:hypothetical protein
MLVSEKGRRRGSLNINQLYALCNLRVQIQVFPLRAASGFVDRVRERKVFPRGVDPYEFVISLQKGKDTKLRVG